jgi:hypothetical protein
MYKCAVAALGLSFSLAACREPTAPEMQSIARSAEHKARSGDLTGLSAMMRDFVPYSGVFQTPIASNEALSIVRDGVRERVNGFVVEEIILTPDGAGEPVIRRSVIAWPNDLSFAISAGGEAHPGQISMAQDNFELNVPALHMYLHTRGDTSKSWRVQNGEVDIGEGEVDRDCARSSERPPYMHYSLESVKCYWAMYQVTLNGDFLTRADYGNPILRSAAKRHHLAIPRQHLPGIRFVTTCPERPEGPNVDQACSSPIRFWRSPSQYAPSLGISIAKMENLDGTFVHLERWPDGKRRVLALLARRWTYHTPDGVLVQAGSRRAMNFFEMGENVDWTFEGITPADVRRMKAILPARSVDPKASHYQVVVLTVEFLEPD